MALAVASQNELMNERIPNTSKCLTNGQLRQLVTQSLARELAVRANSSIYKLLPNLPFLLCPTGFCPLLSQQKYISRSSCFFRLENSHPRSTKWLVLLTLD
jgi:hypothetical protein